MSQQESCTSLQISHVLRFPAETSVVESNAQWTQTITNHQRLVFPTQRCGKKTPTATTPTTTHSHSTIAKDTGTREKKRKRIPSSSLFPLNMDSNIWTMGSMCNFQCPPDLRAAGRSAHRCRSHRDHSCEVPFSQGSKTYCDPQS